MSSQGKERGERERRERRTGRITNMKIPKRYSGLQICDIILADRRACRVECYDV